MLVPAGESFKAAMAGINIARACGVAMCTDLLRGGLEARGLERVHQLPEALAFLAAQQDASL